MPNFDGSIPAGWDREGDAGELIDIATGAMIRDVQHGGGWTLLGDGLAVRDDDPAYNMHLPQLAPPPLPPPVIHPKDRKLPQLEVEEVTRRCLAWLTDWFPGTHMDESTWIEVPRPDPLGTILVRAAKAGTATRVKLTYPLIDDVPMTSELYEYIATDGANRPYDQVRMYPMDNGVAGLRLDFHLIGDTMTEHDLVLAAILIGDETLPGALRTRFGGTIWRSNEEGTGRRKQP